MKIEEKIARAYHKDLSWRKVLVRLEPDAHNNMVVRRMFANAYGWPVVQHICDTHFAYTAAAKTRDEDEDNTERAIDQNEPITREEKQGQSVRGQKDLPEEKEPERGLDKERSATTDNITIDRSSPQQLEAVQADFQKLSTSWTARDRISDHTSPSPSRRQRTESEAREARDDVSELVSHVSAVGESYSSTHSGKAALSRLARQDSARWSDRFFEGSDDGDSDDDGLAAEIRKARERAALDRDPYADPTPDAGTTGARPPSKISEGVLTTSPEPTISRPKGKEKAIDGERLITAPTEPLSAEPGELEPLSHSSGGSSASTPKGTEQRQPGLELEPGSITSLSTGAPLGLSLGEHIIDRQRRETVPDGNGDTGGVAEQVALAASKSHENDGTER
jgi:hypothetical protein